MMNCPKCGAARPEGAAECPRCGVIYARFEAMLAKKREAEAEAARRAQEEQVAQSASAKPDDGSAKLIQCAACGKDVSIMADSCPHCGHPVDKTLRLSPLERKINSVIGWIFAIACLSALFGVYYCSHQITKSVSGGDGTSTAETRPAPVVVKKPNIRTDVPFAIPEGKKVLGCHDIDDYWMLRGFARDGKEAWMEQLKPRLADGRCGAVATGRGRAVEILPSGVAEIRDSRGVKWYVNASAVDKHAGGD